MTAKKKTIKSHSKKLVVTSAVKKGYDHDFFKWTKTQGQLLRTGQLKELDLDHLREEIESLGKNDKRALRSYTIVLLLNLLKREYHLEGKGNSKYWDASILNATREIKHLLEDSPSLKNELKKMFSDAYESAREEAAVEASLDIKKFPSECPWSIPEILPFIR